jgi:hypothetical protein
LRDALLDDCKIRESCASTDAIGQRKIGLPDSGERPSDGTRHARKLADTFYLSEAASLKCGPDREVEVLRSGGSREAAD